MNRLVQNRYLDALLKLMLLSASIHMIILILYSIVKLEPAHVNYFNILDLEFLFPGIEEGLLSNVLSAVCVVIVYLAIFILFTRGKGEGKGGE